MKLVILSCLALVTVVRGQSFSRRPARPFRTETARPLQTGPQIGIIRDQREMHSDGRFSYSFETENGIVVEAEGTPGVEGQSNIRGSYSFPLPDGTIAEFTYVADENGYRVDSPLIPTPHPLPIHAIGQIK